jgi:hypothetical protein
LEWLLNVGLGMARFGVAAECDLAGELAEDAAADNHDDMALGG